MKILEHWYNSKINWNKYTAEAFFFSKNKNAHSELFSHHCTKMPFSKILWAKCTVNPRLTGGWRQNSNWKMAAIIHCTLLILYNQVREDYFDDIFEARRPITNIPSHDERIVLVFAIVEFCSIVVILFLFQLWFQIWQIVNVQVDFFPL